MNNAVAVALVVVCAGCAKADDARVIPPTTNAAAAAPSDTASTSASAPMRNDSAPAPIAPDRTPAPVSPDTTPAPMREGGSDLDVLRQELALPLAGLGPASIHDTFHELRGGSRPHEALDILAPRGTPVLSAADGTLLKLFNSKAGGLMVYAADASGKFILKYGHLDAYAPGLVDGQPLRRGQQIGMVGTTGNAPANTPHLHFAIARAIDLHKWWLGDAVNPYPLLTKENHDE